MPLHNANVQSQRRGNWNVVFPEVMTSTPVYTPGVEPFSRQSTKYLPAPLFHPESVQLHHCKISTPLVCTIPVPLCAAGDDHRFIVKDSASENVVVTTRWSILSNKALVEPSGFEVGYWPIICMDRIHGVWH